MFVCLLLLFFFLFAFLLAFSIMYTSPSFWLRIFSSSFAVCVCVCEVVYL